MNTHCRSRSTIDMYVPVLCHYVSCLMSLCHPLQTERSSKNLASRGPAVVDLRHTASYGSSLCCCYLSKFLSHILSYSYYLLKFFVFSFNTGWNKHILSSTSTAGHSVSSLLFDVCCTKAVSGKKVLPVNHHSRTKGHITHTF